MKIWQDQLEDMLDQVAYLTEDYGDMLMMVAGVPETKEAHEYLSLLVPRLKHMYRKFNWVESKEGFYCVHNYTWEMYQWYNQRDFRDGRATSWTLFVPQDELTPEEREQMRANLYQF